MEEQKTKNEKLDYVNGYLHKNVDNRLIKDINRLKDQKCDFTFPFISLACAGIDFFAGLIKGFDYPPAKRFKNFVEEIMKDVDSKYSIQNISSMIYDGVRCGFLHEGTYKISIDCSSNKAKQKNHLYVAIYNDGNDMVYFHAIQFVEDFIKAQENWRKEQLEKEIDQVYDNLQLLELEPKYMPMLKRKLKQKGLEFNNDDYCSSRSIPQPSSSAKPN